MKILKCNYSIRRKNHIGEFYKYQNEVEFDVIKDLGDSYLISPEGSENTYVVYKDKEAVKEHVLRKLNLEECSNSRMAFSCWIVKGDDLTPYIQEAKQFFEDTLLKKQKELKESISALKLIKVK